MYGRDRGKISLDEQWAGNISVGSCASSKVL